MFKSAQIRANKTPAQKIIKMRLSSGYLEKAANAMVDAGHSKAYLKKEWMSGATDWVLPNGKEVYVSNRGDIR